MNHLLFQPLKSVPMVLLFSLMLGAVVVSGQEETKPGIGSVLYQIIQKDGIEAALQKYQEIRATDSESYNLAERELNSLGYRLVNEKRIEDAIEIFTLNCHLFPDAFNPWDSLAEAYMLAGDKEKAIKNYKKSITLNPDNNAGSDILYLLEHYTKKQYTIPMRDGIHLNTIVYSPRDRSTTYPILMKRTPYGCHPYGDNRFPPLGPLRPIVEEGYIIVFQDVRGRFMSEGEFVNMRPVMHDPEKIDESTDTYDTVEWLLQNVKGHNGKVGMWGSSYPGLYSLMGAISRHPALAAICPQAPPIDWFRGDDFHRNGAFYLLQAVNFFRSVGVARPEPTEEWATRIMTYPSPDLYSFFRSVGPLKNWNVKYFHHQLAYWDTLMKHDRYDDYWEACHMLPHLNNLNTAVLMVGGWYDAEDLYGPLAAYQTIEKNNPSIFNTLVMGPWYHGGWAGAGGTRLNEVLVRSTEAAAYYRATIELPFFNYYLKGKGNLDLPEAMMYDTGKLEWFRLDHWPPRQAVQKRLYFGADESLNWEKSKKSGPGIYNEFVSDPNKPVPHSYRIENRWSYSHMITDQRFAARRPDVLVYATEPLDEDVTVAGPVGVTLYVSTTGTDSDWFVKLVDVYPEDEDDYEGIAYTTHMGEYQNLVRYGVMRGRFRNSLKKPEPFKPGKVTKVAYTLEDVCHTFKKGHKLMIQVQSSCFLLFDINPQTYVNIYEADEKDFQKATHRVYTSGKQASFVQLGMLEKE